MTARLWSVSVVFPSSQSAFICLTSKAKEALDLLTFLKSRGVVVPDGWSLIAANLISADGNIIYGWGLNPDNLVEMYKVVLDLTPHQHQHLHQGLRQQRGLDRLRTRGRNRTPALRMRFDYRYSSDLLNVLRRR